jgi:hypothetical protein
MAWILRNIRWIMVVSGVLTATMLQAAIAPDAALQSTFGETVSGSLALLIVRNWGALIALMGVMLIYGAFNPSERRFILLVVGSSKVFFIALVAAEGTRYLTQQVAFAVGVDFVMVALFAWYLAATRHAAPAGMWSVAGSSARAGR